MASDFLSRILPPATGVPSIYQTLRQEDELSEGADVEERAGLSLDEENLGRQVGSLELDQTHLDAIGDSRVTAAESASWRHNDSQGRSAALRGTQRPGTTPRSQTRRHVETNNDRGGEADEVDDEVPQSLLIEGVEDRSNRNHTGRNIRTAMSPPPSAVPGPLSDSTRAKWERTQAQQGLHQRSPARTPRSGISSGIPGGWRGLGPKERAMWRWANIENLDNFLHDVYSYFLGNGIWSIMLNRFLNLLTLGFVVSFSIFLTMCVDYNAIPGSKTMSQIVVPQCTQKMPWTANLLIWLFSLLWVAKVFQYVVDFRRLQHLHNFFLYLLDVSDTDIQTISWQDVVGRLMALRDSNPTTADGVRPKHRHFMGSQSKQRMDAHDIANRLMRKQNYLIALFNKDILNLTLPVPFLKNRQLFSKTLEWNLSLCILDYVFNHQGQVRPAFLRDAHRRALSDGLRRRFIFAGCMNVVCAPFIVPYLVMLYFFRYFNEYKNHPSRLGSRQYTPLAEWKFREFNELWHLFQRRINMSYPFATRYVDQFPKDKTAQISRFVALIAGAIVSVLALATLVDPQSFLDFEVTPQRTALFYLGVFGSIWAVSSGAVPEENLVFDPEYALNDVTKFTHYMPGHWQGRLHSNEVKSEFSTLYQMKLVIFLEEILSIIFTPFILWFSLPKCSDRLIDFFREFTIHVDGLGYVCSFALFDFKKGSSNSADARSANQGERQRGLRDDYYSTKDGKMLASYYGFLDNYATNPGRPGAPFMHTGVSRYQPGGAIPGIGSPPSGPLRGGVYNVADERHPPSASRHLGVDPTDRPSGRRPFDRPVATSGSISSVLLDPPRQRSLVGERNPRKPPRSPRTRRDPQGDLAEVSPERLGPPGPQHSSAAGVGSASGEGVSDGSLGDSWKTTRAATQEDENADDDDDVDAVTGDKGAGVLGLLYQFQKTQAGGRAPGVNI